MHNLIIFASGRGSNAAAIYDYFQQRADVRICLVVSNKQDAGILPWAAEKGIQTLVVNRPDFSAPEMIEVLRSHKPSLIVLAGFLWMIPEGIVQAFPESIINIHPALLPAYGGKGMWGHHVHQAVIDEEETESGITIHRVNEHYDEGSILLQARCPVIEEDNADSLATRVLKLEHFYFPRTIEFLLREI